MANVSDTDEDDDEDAVATIVRNLKSLRKPEAPAHKFVMPAAVSCCAMRYTSNT